MHPLSADGSHARCIAIAGPLTGMVLQLNGRSVHIGRDTTNDICLSDLALSRLHCTIDLQDGVWRIRDSHSSNGTFVNGTQVTDHALNDRDRITLGASLFLFVIDPPGSSLAGLTDRSGEIVTHIRVDDDSWLHAAGQETGSRAEHDLRALVRISKTINSVSMEEDLHRELLDLLTETIPADQTAVITVPADGEFEIVARRHDPGVPAVPVSQTIVRQALRERISLLTRDVAATAGSATVASPVGDGGQSVLCVPMVIRNRPLGALYLTTIQANAFDEDRLRLLTAIANVAAVALENVRHVAWLHSEKDRLQAALEGDHGGLVGRGAAMQRIFTLIAKVARSDATTVLITGETGTGKELVARAIHLNSKRAKRPFVAINCAALADTLLETELFGHERGAFTGAVAQKKGKLELAEGGTVFLDEVGELAPGLQSKLLRALQEREIERVGGTRPVRVDVRLVSATNRALPDDVAAGRFRRDLFHRLNVVQIDVPPLRERREDIPQLASHFVVRFASKAARPICGISHEALKYLTAYDWPGNVRELENTIERAIVLGSSESILREDLPEAVLERAPTRPSDAARFHEAVRDAKVRVILDAFREARCSYTDAAHLLGLHPNYLHRLIRNLDLKPVLEQER
jgi:transcriptional regulator with GAF, ATPase, and Fis domain